MDSFISSSLHWLVSRFDEDQNLKYSDTIDEQPYPGSPSRSFELEYEESDFFLSPDETSESISNRVLLQRSKKLQSSKNYSQFLGTSSPSKTQFKNSTKIRPVGVQRDSKAQKAQERQEALVKVDSFIDIPRMVYSLNSLEQLIKDPEFKYNDFKRNYIRSSFDLLDCVKDKDELKDYLPGSISSGYPITKTYSHTTNLDQPNEDQKTQLVIQIMTLSYKVFRVFVELITPIIFQLVIWLKNGVHNEIIEKIFFVLGNIFLITLSILLESLQSYQRKKQRA